MEILTAQQIKNWDAHTIANEPITSIDLMERAAASCVEWLLQKECRTSTFQIFCGPGKNGADGFAIARLLLREQCNVTVYMAESTQAHAEEFIVNHGRLLKTSIPIHNIGSAASFPSIAKDAIIIDALFGTGLNRELAGIYSLLVDHFNLSGATVISIDLPSGLLMDRSSKGAVVKAHYTLTFQCYKIALLLQENATYFGNVVVLPIGLHPSYPDTLKNVDRVIDASLGKTLIKERPKFGHKGTFGHVLLVGGSYGKMGAMVLSTRACLRCGAGLTTALFPACGYNIMQISAPEAMVITDADQENVTALPADIEKYNVIGIGPGLGTGPGPKAVLSFIIRRYKHPLVIDADGLNCLSMQKDLLPLLTPNSILTPHPKEFDRLFGNHTNDFDRAATARIQAVQLQIIIVLKGHHTMVAMPVGGVFFNSTGNSGMAKGGSGDVLTGMITSFLSQGYTPQNAALAGVYIHGLAGDAAAQKFSQHAMLPSNLIDCLGDVFLSFE